MSGKKKSKKVKKYKDYKSLRYRKLPSHWTRSFTPAVARHFGKKAYEFWKKH